MRKITIECENGEVRTYNADEYLLYFVNDGDCLQIDRHLKGSTKMVIQQVLNHELLCDTIEMQGTNMKAMVEVNDSSAIRAMAEDKDGNNRVPITSKEVKNDKE